MSDRGVCGWWETWSNSSESRWVREEKSGLSLSVVQMSFELQTWEEKGDTQIIKPGGNTNIEGEGSNKEYFVFHLFGI